MMRHSFSRFILATWMLSPPLFGCHGGDEEPSFDCEEACVEIVEEYGRCREDLNGPELCTDYCDGGRDEREVKRLHECLDEHDFSCESFTEPCSSRVLISIVVRLDDERAPDEWDQLAPASCSFD